MNQELENLQQISVDDIKECLKRNIPNEYDKMIISSDVQINRADYFYVKHKSVYLTRHGKIVKFPLYGNIQNSFSELEGGQQKHEEKSILKSERILEILQSDYNIVPEDYNITSANQPFEFPIDTEGDSVLKEQRKYFFPDLTYQEKCNACNGEKYVTCSEPDCQGKHEWVCPDCNGDRKIICNICNGDRKVLCDNCGGDGKTICSDCKGSGYVKCGAGVGGWTKRGLGNIAGGGCGGTGKVKDDNAPTGYRTCKTCRGKGEVACKTCGTRGEVRCEICNGRGEVICDNCNGQGTLSCETCNATGKIICDVCYGDSQKYGLVDCPQCNTQGVMAQIAFVETEVHNNEIKKLFHTGDQLTEIDDDQITSKHSDKSAQTTVTLININQNIKENYDEYSQKYGNEILNELGYKRDTFPKISNEEMYYQVIPCVQVSYKHILTNAEHEISILNFFKSPEIIMHSKAEEVKKDIGNAGKAVGGLFGKLFKTKAFKSKRDKKNEITLMIYLAKADGKIEEEEKNHISELIGNLDDFTANEKQSIFNLMNSTTLPELTVKQTTFSSKNRADEVVSILEKLAIADGELEGQEKEFIEKVKTMLKYK